MKLLTFKKETEKEIRWNFERENFFGLLIHGGLIFWDISGKGPKFGPKFGPKLAPN